METILETILGVILLAIIVLVIWYYQTNFTLSTTVSH